MACAGPEESGLNVYSINTFTEAESPIDRNGPKAPQSCVTIVYIGIQQLNLVMGKQMSPEMYRLETSFGLFLVGAPKPW